MQAHNIKILEAIAAAWGCGRGPAWLSPLQSPRKKKLLHEKMSALPASTSKKGEKSNAGSSLPILELLSSFPNNVTLWSFSLQNAPHEPFELLCSSLLLPKAFKNAPINVGPKPDQKGDHQSSCRSFGKVFEVSWTVCCRSFGGQWCTCN